MGRRWCAVLAACAVALNCLAGTHVASAEPEAMPAQARAQATRLTLAVSADEVYYASRVTLSGRLTAGGKGVRKEKVVLKVRAGSSRTWQKVGVVTTTRRGTWRKVVEARLRARYIAVFKGSRTLAATKAAVRTVDVFAPLTDVTVSPGNRDAYVNEEWTWTARTAPELAGSTASLVRGPFRTPTTVRTAVIGPGGAISLTHPMSDVGAYEYWLSVDSSALMSGRDSARTLIRTRREGAPSVATTSLPSVEVHVPYRATLVGAGGGLTWSVVGGALPPGLALSPDGTISGVPSATGTWGFTVQAANLVGAATTSLTLTSTPGSLTVGTFALDDAAVGVAYPDGLYSNLGWQEMWCEPCPDGASWSVTAGSLPPGLELVADDFVEPVAHYVAGRPTQAGVWSFTITGVAGTRSGSKQFSIRVLPSAADMLQISVNPSFNHLPAATVGTPYSQQLEANTGAGLTWTALASLPPGLTLSAGGLLSGTPTLAGDGPIYVAVTDGTRYDWEQFRITVHPAP